MEKNIENIRRDILHSVLRDVPFDGWDRAASQAKVRVYFPHGAQDIITYFWNSLDENSLIVDKSLRTQEKVRTLLESWFEHAADYKLCIAKIYSKPLLLTALSWKTIDKIWYEVGDQSSDFNYYTKRATLYAIFTSTMLYWLKCSSVEDLKGFIQRRMDNVMEIGKLLAYRKK